MTRRYMLKIQNRSLIRHWAAKWREISCQDPLLSDYVQYRRFRSWLIAQHQVGISTNRRHNYLEFKDARKATEWLLKYS